MIELGKRNISRNIFLDMERRMECGSANAHCHIGDNYAVLTADIQFMEIRT